MLHQQIMLNCLEIFRVKKIVSLSRDENIIESLLLLDTGMISKYDFAQFTIPYYRC